MDIKELSNEKKGVELRIEQNIKEFEKKTGMRVTGFKIKRVDSAEKTPPVESVTMKVEIPDTD